VALLLFDKQRSEVEVSQTVNDGQATVGCVDVHPALHNRAGRDHLGLGRHCDEHRS
jgi:hypothetical protein